MAAPRNRARAKSLLTIFELGQYFFLVVGVCWIVSCLLGIFWTKFLRMSFDGKDEIYSCCFGQALRVIREERE